MGNFIPIDIICILWPSTFLSPYWRPMSLVGRPHGACPYVVAMNWASDVLLGPNSSQLHHSKIRGSDLSPLQMFSSRWLLRLFFIEVHSSAVTWIRSLDLWIQGSIPYRCRHGACMDWPAKAQGGSCFAYVISLQLRICLSLYSFIVGTQFLLSDRHETSWACRMEPQKRFGVFSFFIFGQAQRPCPFIPAQSYLSLSLLLN